MGGPPGRAVNRVVQCLWADGGGAGIIGIRVAACLDHGGVDRPRTAWR